ncbi:hypothetical protein [Celeribacter ethanolicus]|uniref:hypothetical protein n=1 Tax=Celeribacter ethanolicus TaxID=1758178 RepID=UPI000836E56F|nr:hypothetical protein [Celeribacter ethanolicus]
MSKYAILLMSALAVTAPAAFAQEATGDEQVTLPPAGDVQNFLPLLAPTIGLLGVALASGGGSSSTSTTSTTSTN